MILTGGLFGGEAEPVRRGRGKGVSNEGVNVIEVHYTLYACTKISQ
jgi:hypothetical protein